MQHPDEGTIHAWIDGELSPEEAAALEAHLKECAECSALAAEARGLVAASSRIVSALDIVPGDVIPKAQPKRRAWYASTQFRAAAAVVIVAGASLLVMRDKGVMQLERAVSENAPASTSTDASAPAPTVAPVATMVEPQIDKAASAPAPMVKGGRVRVAEKSALKAEPKVQAESDARSHFGKVAIPLEPITAASRAPEKVIDAPASVSVAADELSQRRDASRELKKIRIDSAKNETVYEVEPGVEVTLTDNGEPARIMLRATTQSKARQLAVPAPAPPPPSANVAGAAVAKVAVADSITWTSRQGHRMVLKGPLSREELEKIRQRLNEDQR